MAIKICLDCKCEVDRYYAAAVRCVDCAHRRTRELEKTRLKAIKDGTHVPRQRLSDLFRDNNNIAHKLVAAAIRYGFLLPANSHKCVDCGDPAIGYDHRDYNKPLEVEPVCTRCNNHRGPGIPLVLPKQKTEVAA